MTLTLLCLVAWLSASLVSGLMWNRLGYESSRPSREARRPGPAVSVGPAVSADSQDAAEPVRVIDLTVFDAATSVVRVASSRSAPTD